MADERVTLSASEGEVKLGVPWASLVALLAKLLPVVLPIILDLLKEQENGGNGPERVQ
jgi:hypothetical protein